MGLDNFDRAKTLLGFHLLLRLLLFEFNSTFTEHSKTTICSNPFVPLPSMAIALTVIRQTRIPSVIHSPIHTIKLSKPSTICSNPFVPCPSMAIA
jgi:hypothetical protein